MSSLALVVNQTGLVLGLVAAILLALPPKVGVKSIDGTIIFSGLDPMASTDGNVKRVLASHWRSKFLTPTGFVMLSFSFLLQFAATIIQ